MARGRIRKTPIFLTIAGLGAIAGLSAWALDVKAEMAPLLQKVEEQKQIIQEQEEEIKRLQEGVEEAKLAIEPKQMEEAVEEAEISKQTAQPHDNGETPDGSQYGFQYCPN